MIEHEKITKSSALAMFKRLESNSAPPPPVYTSHATKSFLKKPEEKPKSILKKTPETVLQPDIVRATDASDDTDELKGVSVAGLKSQFGQNNNTTIERKEKPREDDFDIMAEKEPELRQQGLKQMPEDFIQETGGFERNKYLHGNHSLVTIAM